MAFAEASAATTLGNDAPHELLRCVEGVSGEVELVMELAPRPDYGLIRPLIRLEPGGARTFGGPAAIGVTSPVALEVEASTMRASFTVAAGDERGFALRWASPEAPRRPRRPRPTGSPRGSRTRSRRGGRGRPSTTSTTARTREHVRLSSRVLKGLTFRPTGAIVAAPTTSLPETVGGERNWDYRYSWIRDASLTLEALYVGACSDEAEEFVSFMTSSAGGRAGEGSLQIMYGIGGEHDLSERSSPHLRGWRDSAPVRVGNGAWDQVQLDVYGELLSALHLYRERLGDLHPEIQAFVADLADTAARRWTETDSGMWEMRGAPRHHLSSKVLCWTALDRAVKLAPQLGMHAKVAEWERARDEVRAAILERGWSETRQAYAQSFDSDELDAAQLLMPILGFLPATDDADALDDRGDRARPDRGRPRPALPQRGGPQRGRAHRRGGHVRHLLVLARGVPGKAGELERAEALFDQLAGYANDLGLLAEEIDTRSGEQLGNFPQAFSHIGLITAAAEIDKAREAAR